jgi:hypothetical protein
MDLTLRAGHPKNMRHLQKFLTVPLIYVKYLANTSKIFYFASGVDTIPGKVKYASCVRNGTLVAKVFSNSQSVEGVPSSDHIPQKLTDL